MNIGNSCLWAEEGRLKRGCCCTELWECIDNNAYGILQVPCRWLKGCLFCSCLSSSDHSISRRPVHFWPYCRPTQGGVGNWEVHSLGECLFLLAIPWLLISSYSLLFHFLSCTNAVPVECPPQVIGPPLFMQNYNFRGKHRDVTHLPKSHLIFFPVAVCTPIGVESGYYGIMGLLV